MAHICIIVGSVYGGAKLVAEDIQTALQELAFSCTLLERPLGTDLENDDIDMLLVCTSTTGAGDLPDELLPLLADLTQTPPRIAGLKFAVIALGDSSYGETFCGGGLSLDHALADIGATRVADPLKLDAMETVTPEEDAVPWALDLIQQVV